MSGLATIGSFSQPSAATLEPGSVFAERYEVISKLGEGGMGVVYLTRDPGADVHVVVKLIHPRLLVGEAAVSRLLAEGRTARAIRHPNIVAVYDVAKWQDQPYFTMEYVPGRTLRSWLVENLADHRDAPLSVVVRLVRAILAGLAEAHRVGVVHRDLKPENVMLVGDPSEDSCTVKILDFGIARAFGTTLASQTGPAQGSGTPFYTAPEQLTSADAVRASADLYSLSVMLYEMLVQVVPQGGRWEPISHARPDVPIAFDALVDKGVSLRPRGRFQSVAEYSAALDEALAASSTPPRMPHPPAPEPVVPPLPRVPASGPAPVRPPARDGLAVVADIRQRVDRAGFTWKGPGLAGGRAFDIVAEKSTGYWEHLVLGRRFELFDVATLERYVLECCAAAEESLLARFSLVGALFGKSLLGCIPVMSVAHVPPSIPIAAMKCVHPIVKNLLDPPITIAVLPVVFDEERLVGHFSAQTSLAGIFSVPFLRSEVSKLFPR